MIISTIRMAIPAEKQNDALRIIRSIAMHSRDSSGCLGYHFYKDIEDSDVLMLQGNWKSEENLNHHLRSDEYRNLLLVLEMSLKQPEVSFDIISSSMGIENIERIRGVISEV